jgi:hypothetical protein
MRQSSQTSSGALLDNRGARHRIARHHGRGHHGRTVTHFPDGTSWKLPVTGFAGRGIKVTPDGSGFESWEATGPGFKIVEGPEKPMAWTGTAWNQD